MLKHGILGLLNYGEMTGYELRETFNHSLDYFWPAQSSQIYRELHAMEEKGWLVSETVEQTGKPDKNVCRITEEGRGELLRWLGEYGEVSMRSSLLMRVFFLGERSDEDNALFFGRFADECSKKMMALEQTTEIINEYETMLQSPKRARFWKMTVDYGKRSLQTYIDWANDCARILEEEEQ